MQIGIKKFFLVFFCVILGTLEQVKSEIHPDKVFTADSKKTGAFQRDGIIIGGDQAIHEVIVKDIRQAVNQGFERMVIDLETSFNGEPSPIERPPYYQLAVTPDERRLIITLWGGPKLQFKPNKVLNAFKKSAVVEKVLLFPKLEEGSWTFALELKVDASVEVFELSHPVRVIVDIRPKKS